jgi:cobalt-zinc-cadmium efflux system membrane fusion protein
MKRRLLVSVSLVLGLACNTSGERDAVESEAAPGEHEHAEHEQHEVPQGERREVELTAEAIELAGIRVAAAERRALTGGVAIPAEVQFEPSSTAHVAPLVSGRITRVQVALGDRVKKGQLLGVVASSDVSSARARLDQARARLSAAESTLRRQQQLASEGIGAQRQLIDAEAQVSELRAEVDGVRRQLSVFGSGRAGELALTSSIDGVVVMVHGTIGETASPDEPVFIVTDPSRVWVRGNVPELELARVQAGSAALVRLHAFPELALAGSVTYVAPALDEQTRSLPIRVALAAPDARLKSGLFGSIELVGGAADERVLVVPVDAVATIEGQTVVFVPGNEPHAFRAQPVALGRRAGAFFELRAGLDEGAALAVSGAFTLKSAFEGRELSEGHSH